MAWRRAWAHGLGVTPVADVEIDREDIDWMRCTYKEARSKNKAIPILAQCTGLTHAQVRAALGLPDPSAKCSAKKDRALALLARGYPQQRVAIMVGAAPVTVRGWAKQAREEGSREV